MERRLYFRDRNRINDYKRKEAGALKKTLSKKQEYTYKTKNVKEAPTIEDVKNLKCIKPKIKLVKIDDLEYQQLIHKKRKLII